MTFERMFSARTPTVAGRRLSAGAIRTHNPALHSRPSSATAKPGTYRAVGTSSRLQLLRLQVHLVGTSNSVCRRCRLVPAAVARPSTHYNLARGTRQTDKFHFTLRRGGSQASDLVRRITRLVRLGRGFRRMALPSPSGRVTAMKMDNPGAAASPPLQDWGVRRNQGPDGAPGHRAFTWTGNYRDTMAALGHPRGTRRSQFVHPVLLADNSRSGIFLTIVCFIDANGEPEPADWIDLDGTWRVGNSSRHRFSPGIAALRLNAWAVGRLAKPRQASAGPAPEPDGDGAPTVTTATDGEGCDADDAAPCGSAILQRLPERLRRQSRGTRYAHHDESTTRRDHKPITELAWSNPSRSHCRMTRRAVVKSLDLGFIDAVYDPPAMCGRRG